MRVGVPKEVKNHEYRVAITPVGVHELAVRGHEVEVQQGAGEGSQISDDDFVAAGARLNEKKPSRVAEGERDDLAFALPVVPGTMLGPKKEAARALLGTTVASFWDET